MKFIILIFLSVININFIYAESLSCENLFQNKTTSRKQIPKKKNTSDKSQPLQTSLSNEANDQIKQKIFSTIKNNKLTVSKLKKLINEIDTELHDQQKYPTQMLVDMWNQDLIDRIEIHRAPNDTKLSVDTTQNILPGLSRHLEDPTGELNRNHFAFYARLLLKELGTDRTAKWYNFLGNDLQGADFFQELKNPIPNSSSILFKQDSDSDSRVVSDQHKLFSYLIQKEIAKRLKENPESFYTELNLHNPQNSSKKVPHPNDIIELYKEIDMQPPPEPMQSELWQSQLNNLFSNLFRF